MGAPPKERGTAKVTPFNPRNSGVRIFSNSTSTLIECDRQPPTVCCRQHSATVDATKCRQQRRTAVTCWLHSASKFVYSIWSIGRDSPRRAGPSAMATLDLYNMTSNYKKTPQFVRHRQFHSSVVYVTYSCCLLLRDGFMYRYPSIHPSIHQVYFRQCP